MVGLISNVQISCPGEERPVLALAALYGELLGMQRSTLGDIKLGHKDGHLPGIGFETYSEDAPPRWPDPEYPQQVHLDIEVGDLDVAEAIALRSGATRLRDNGEHRILADSVGHPFCLYGNHALPPMPGRMARIVFDCFSPRSLAVFYEQLLGFSRRVENSPEHVVIGPADGRLPLLAFQHVRAYLPPRWPDPRYPQQMHFDLEFDDREAAEALALALGGIPLPAQGGSCPVYADPAGHPHCFCSPGE